MRRRPLPPDFPASRRKVRSFVRREGRMTAGQRRALQECWPQYGVAAGAEPFVWHALFKRAAPLALEIGFGNGDALLQLARERPEWNVAGVEIHRPGIGALLVKLGRTPLPNVRLVCADALDVMRRNVPPASVDLLLLFFPDPWPKKRHHKRRLVNPAFAALCCECLRPGGMLHAATDWDDYAGQMMAVFSACDALCNAAGAGRYTERPAWRPVTRFEQRGRGLGHRCFDLVFVRREAAAPRR